ncbi:MAG: hypothetical protein ACI8TP_003494 [Acidimicrobiales bacterium]
MRWVVSEKLLVGALEVGSKVVRLGPHLKTLDARVRTRERDQAGRPGHWIEVNIERRTWADVEWGGLL